MKLGLEKSYIPHKNYKLAFEDDFEDQSLSEQKWVYREDERLGGLNLAENVKIEEGRLKINYEREEVNAKS